MVRRDASEAPLVSSHTRHRLFDAAFAAIALSGANRWLAPIARGRGVILTFHHVSPEPPGPYAPNRILTITPDFLDRILTALAARGFDIVGLDSVPERLTGPAARRPFAALTFDDGYRDNVEHAAPVLRRHGAPWALYVASDFAEGTGRLWWIELERAIGRLDRVRIDAESLGGEPALDLPSGGANAKSAAFDAVYRRLRAGPEERLLAVIATLCAEAGIDAAGIAPSLCLTWDELSALSRDPAVTIGAHTIGHPMLAKRAAGEAAFEIAEGRARIEARLGRPVRHLSYPVGDPTSAGPREFAMAREMGFSTGVTTRPGHLFAAHASHLHALPRVSANGCHQSGAALAALLSGAPFLAWNRGRRLDVG